MRAPQTVTRTQKRIARFMACCSRARARIPTKKPCDVLMEQALYPSIGATPSGGGRRWSASSSPSLTSPTGCAPNIDLRDVIRTAIEALTPVLEERQTRLSTAIADVILPVRGDGDRIQQVVVNLLSNAARYSPASCRAAISFASGSEFETSSQVRVGEIFEPQSV